MIKDFKINNQCSIEEMFNRPKKELSWKNYVFKKKGTNCVKCSAVGVYFIEIEHQNKHITPAWHLVTIDTDGREDILTIDHIKPKIKGGKDGLYNLQPMCHRCNCQKGAKEICYIKK